MKKIYFLFALIVLLSFAPACHHHHHHHHNDGLEVIKVTNPSQGHHHKPAKPIRPPKPSHHKPAPSKPVGKPIPRPR